MSNANEKDDGLQPWEQEVLARHRWGRHGDEKASEEHARLKRLWEAAQPLDQPCTKIAEQIVALEICNWKLEDSILALCAAIGAKKPAEIGIGHMASFTDERRKKVWAYCLALRDWLPAEIPSGYGMLLGYCDPAGEVRDHVRGLLGETNELKELYVERFCLCLEFWLGGCFPRDSAPMKAHAAAVSAVEQEISKRDPDGEILGAFQLEGDGKLNLCHHKLFRRYDIILSSIGAGKWRGAMPMRGTDGLQRAATLEKFLSLIEAWIGTPDTEGHKEDNLFEDIHTRLGAPDDTKVFLASLLVSLLRCQQLFARTRAESRMKKPQS